MSAEVKSLDLETFKSLIREVAGEVLKEMDMPEMGMKKGGAKAPGMSEQDEIVALDIEEVPADGAMPPMGGMDDMDSGEFGAEGDDLDVEEDGGGEGVFDMDLSTPEGVADALEDLTDMLARIADAVEDVVSTEGGDYEEMEATEEALGEARRLVRRARKSILRENAKKYRKGRRR